MDGSEQRSFAATGSSEQIAAANDKLRKTGRDGQVLATRGVTSLVGFDATELMTALAQYDRFDEYNNPHGERDFGDLNLWSAEILWKIDYYNQELTRASPDPASETVTTRVLTVMLAEEY